jgi:hypothetical protein
MALIGVLSGLAGGEGRGRCIKARWRLQRGFLSYQKLLICEQLSTAAAMIHSILVVEYFLSPYGSKL